MLKNCFTVRKIYRQMITLQYFWQYIILLKHLLASNYLFCNKNTIACPYHSICYMYQPIWLVLQRCRRIPFHFQSHFHIHTLTHCLFQENMYSSIYLSHFNHLLIICMCIYHIYNIQSLYVCVNIKWDGPSSKLLNLWSNPHCLFCVVFCKYVLITCI